VRYYHGDRRGDTVMLTDGTGAVTDRMSYGLYGELGARTGSTNTPFLFNGIYGVQTDANGLTYHRARYYHPGLRRFLNQDTVLGDIGGSASLNRFAYANGCPVSLIDPFGLAARDPNNGYWSQVGWNVSYFSYGVLRGIFHDLPVGAWEMAKLAVDPDAQAQMALSLYTLATDADARQAVVDGIKESWSTQEGAMMNIGRLGGQIIGTKGLTELKGLTSLAENETSLLQGHVDNAVSRLEAEGLTPAQKLALVDNPNLKAAFEGERIDHFFRQSVADDPALTHLELTPRGKFGPDVFDPATQRWWDVTTPKSWEAHTQKYWLFGEGTPLLTK
jgi:RHS repeat-associated protein